MTVAPRAGYVRVTVLMKTACLSQLPLCAAVVGALGSVDSNQSLNHDNQSGGHQHLLLLQLLLLLLALELSEAFLMKHLFLHGVDGTRKRLLLVGTHSHHFTLHQQLIPVPGHLVKHTRPAKCRDQSLSRSAGHMC